MVGYYCKPDSLGKRDKDRAPCLDQTGSPRCAKRWTAWSDWSHCVSECGGETKRRERRCEGFGRNCTGPFRQYDPCPIQRHCPVIDGRWGGWGRWTVSCSVTCGHGVRKRIRKCNNPSPSGGGRTCEGDAQDTKLCHIDAVCPIHGNWTEWTPWVCDQTCDGTTGVRVRLCDNPAPQFGGRFCIGESKDYTNECNNFPCPTENPVPKIPHELLEKLQDDLDRQLNSFQKLSGEYVDLDCNTPVMRLFQAQFPRGSVRWVHNGYHLALDPERMAYERNLVFINHVLSADNGVYLCQFEYFPNNSKVLALFALTVISDVVDISTTAGNPVSILCHGGSVAVVFPATRQQWIHDGTVYQDYGVTSPLELDTVRIARAKEADSGVWECRVSHPRTNRTWITNRLILDVGPAPSILERMLTPVYLGTCGGVVFIVVVCAVAYFSYRKKKAEDAAEAEQRKALLQGTPDEEEHSDSGLEVDAGDRNSTSSVSAGHAHRQQTRGHVFNRM